MVSTGGANDMTIEERTTGLEAKPDISGVESGSMNFGDETFITPPPAGRGIVERALDAGIALEVEAFDVGHVVSAVRWLEDGLLPEPMRINLVFGVPGGIDASPEALAAMVRPLPPGTFWTVTCIGRHHQRLLGLALLMGAPGIRTGLEDVSYISKGVLAPSNAALVEMARRPGRHARPRGRHPGAGEGAACTLAERRRTRQGGARRGVTAARRAGAARRRGTRSTPPRSSCSPSAGTTRPRCGRSPTRRRSSRRRSTTGIPARRRSWSSSRTTSWTSSPTGCSRRWPGTSARRCGWRRPSASTSTFHGVHSRAAFVTDSEIRALRPAPRRALIAQRDAYQERFGELIRAGIADGSLAATHPDVATYAILLQCTGAALWFDPAGPLTVDEVADAYVELVLGSLQAAPELIAEAVEATR